eukprot:CAMPEP_0170545848 /NCGR_PEP_ID=MMETSP0211-20121228/4214_1 /TAXON_ID=311385 /ORGANISM="Pseudokeronopsis sp., Strain OXSARD2" /LENGTH=66 /DNA_ID=CAMNT_0010849983 /DNA_START=438 /DNA_END=638 /DNA_ORIENTATION=-
MNPLVSQQNVKDFFMMMFYFAISLRLEIEQKKDPKDQSPEILDYLSSGHDVEKLVEDRIIKRLPAE